MERVRRTGRRIQLPLVTVWIAEGATLNPRVAIIVPLHGNSAIVRNRLKRRVRYILRSEILVHATHAYDAVVSARSMAYAATFEDLKGSLIEAFLK